MNNHVGNNSFMQEHVCQHPPLFLTSQTNQHRKQAKCLPTSVDEHGFYKTQIICLASNHKV